MNAGAFEGKSALEIFRIIAPGYSAVSDDIVQGYIDIASLFVCVNRFGDAYQVALAYMAAHIMQSPGGYGQNGSSYQGQLTSFSADGLSFSYASVDSSSTSYMSGTSFGTLYQMLLRKAGGGFGIMTRGPGGYYP